MRSAATPLSVLLLVVILAGCSPTRPGELTREDFDEGMRALAEGDLETVDRVADRLRERDPAEPLVPFFRGMLARRRGDAEGAEVLFNEFYASAYDRYVKGYAELSIHDRGLIQTARAAALEVSYLYIEENRYMDANLFNILVDDFDAVVKHGGAGR
ncbi:MAG TPA: hypothetical protein ENN88_02405 [Candidatus Coatesbacteria bacterium]|nr:hypothetical protein [Candidatus Coatesbacteria bacterium]